MQVKTLIQRISQRLNALGHYVPYLHVASNTLTDREIEIFRTRFGFEPVLIPSLQDVQIDDAYFKTFYPNRNSFWKDEYISVISQEHEQLGGQILLYESIQKPDFQGGAQLYGSVDGREESKDPLLSFFMEAYSELKESDDPDVFMMVSQNRYTWSYELIEKYVLPKLQKEVERMGLRGNVAIRPATNFVDSIFFPYNGETETYEWTRSVLPGTKNHLTVGHAPLGGLSCILDHDPATCYANIGVRFMIIL